MRIWSTVALPTLVLAVLVAGLAGVLGGPAVLLRAAVGGGLAWSALASAPVVLGAVSRRSPVASLPVALAFYAATSVVLLVVLALLVEGGWVAAREQLAWLAGSMSAVSFAWVICHARGLQRDRTPTYDLRNNS